MRNGFPFLIPQLTSAESTAWNNDRAKYIGPLNLAQLIELWFRVNQYKLTFTGGSTIGVTVTPWTWNSDATPPRYELGTVVPVNEAPASGYILADMTGIAGAPAAKEPLLQLRQVPAYSGLPFAGSAMSDNLSFAFNFSLFNGPGPILYDDSGGIIDNPQIFYQAMADDSGRYYVPWTFQLIASLRTDGSYSGAYTPLWNGGGFPSTVQQGSDTTVYTWQNSEIDGGSNVGVTAYPDSLEFKSANTTLDITGLTLLASPFTALLEASQYWSYNGKYNTNNGAYSG